MANNVRTRKAPKRRRPSLGPVELANLKDDDDFVRSYLDPPVPGTEPWRTAWTHPKTGDAYSIRLCRSTRAGDAVLDACYDLVEQTSRADYDASRRPWNAAAKRAEMREADLRYVLVERGGRMHGFASLMPTHEAGRAVVYCYEIHLKPELVGTGLGALLLGFLRIVAHNLGAPVAGVMLTCYLRNTRAQAFYQKQGFVPDASSPSVRELRGGKTILPDFAILIRPAERSDKETATTRPEKDEPAEPGERPAKR